MHIPLKSTVVVGLLLAGVGTAIAQDVVIAPEQETVIREYVVKQHVEPIAPPPGLEITVGSTIPDAVKIYGLDVADMPAQYSFVVIEGRTLLIDPSTRRIVRILR